MFDLDSLTPHQNTHDDKGKNGQKQIIFKKKKEQLRMELEQNKPTSLKEFPEMHHPSPAIPAPHHREARVLLPREPGSQPSLTWV